MELNLVTPWKKWDAMLSQLKASILSQDYLMGQMQVS
jgi:hypothetical protein